MTARAQSPEALRSSVKGTAILCLLLGPSLWLVPLACGMTRWLQKVTRSTYDLPLSQTPKVFLTILRFGESSGWIVVPLGFVMFYAGFDALRNLDRGRRRLVLAGWIATAAMVLLAALWGVLAAQDELSTGLVLVGVVGHVLQAAIIVKACVFLGSEAVVKACASPDPSSIPSEAH